MLVGKFLHNKPDDGRHPEAIGGWDTYKTIFRLNDLFFSGEIKVMLTQNGRVFYGISQIKNITDSTRDLLGESPTLALCEAFLRLASNPMDASFRRAY